MKSYTPRYILFSLHNDRFLISFSAYKQETTVSDYKAFWGLSWLEILSSWRELTVQSHHQIPGTS